jgi:hypothetical protein
LSGGGLAGIAIGVLVRVTLMAEAIWFLALRGDGSAREIA